MKNHRSKGAAGRKESAGYARGRAEREAGIRSSSSSKGNRQESAGKLRGARKQQAPEIAGLPVSKNDEVVIDIIGMNHDGEGVGRADGYTLFVPGALPGEKVATFSIPFI